MDHCFDEHRAALAEPRAAGVCGAQHGAARAFAWEAAADVARTTQPAARGGAGGASALLAVVAGGLGGAAGLVLARRRRSWGSQGGGGLLPDSAGHLAPPSSVARRVRLPRIDESRCLGCFACVDACPYDVLAIESYVAKVVREDACCGVVLCQQRCPNGSLVIAEGEVRTDVPRISEDLESELVPGVYLAGDVTGGSLIKNAIRQGTAAIDAKGAYGKSLPLDVLVIGGGPAGIAAALRAKERGLRCVVLEKGSVAESIRSYPRGKLVFDQPLELPAVGKLWLEESTKEELLAQWTRVVRRERIEVREGRTVRSLRRIDGGFEVSSVATDASEGHEDAETLCASRVIVAVGRRGAARKLAVPVPDDAVSSVFYHLADARSFEGKSVVVVGLGDVAMEAALALAGQAGTTVTLVHRGADFSRGSARNVAAVRALVATAGLSLRLSTEVVAVGAASLTLARGGTDEVLETDAIFVLIGTEPPRALLKRLGLLSGDLPPLPSV